MKILFYIAEATYTKKLGVTVKHTLAKDYTEANKIKKGCIDKKTYNLIKTLENNKDFEKEIKLLRGQHAIPTEGYSFEQWVEFRKNFSDKKKLFNWEQLLRINTAPKLEHHFKIPELLSRSLQYILVGNFIYLPLNRIVYEGPKTLLTTHYLGPEINISIHAPISKSELIRFVDNNWPEIEKDVKELGKDTNTALSARDTEIIRLRDDEKLKFSEIADKLAEKYDDYAINEDMIKQAYHRAIDKVNRIKR